MEIEMIDKELFFEIDNKAISKIGDLSPYKGGKLIIRARGTEYEKASYLIKM